MRNCIHREGIILVVGAAAVKVVNRNTRNPVGLICTSYNSRKCTVSIECKRGKRSSHIGRLVERNRSFRSHKVVPVIDRTICTPVD